MIDPLGMGVAYVASASQHEHKQMSDPIDPRAVAARLRAIIGSDGGNQQDRSELTARRLNVSQVGLRISIDELEPHPAIEVLDAVVREYGVDPTWLLTGNYDVATHRLALDDEATDSGQPPLAALLRARGDSARAQSGQPSLRLEA